MVSLARITLDQDTLFLNPAGPASERNIEMC